MLGFQPPAIGEEEIESVVETLRSVSHNPVLYAELPRTQHAFDVMYTVRAAHVVDVIARWLESLRPDARDTAAPVRPILKVAGAD